MTCHPQRPTPSGHSATLSSQCPAAPRNLEIRPMTCASIAMGVFAPPTRPERPEKMILAVVDTLSCCPLLLVVDAIESDGLAIWQFAMRKKFAMKKREGHHSQFDVIMDHLLQDRASCCRSFFFAAARMSHNPPGLNLRLQLRQKQQQNAKNRCNSTTGSPIRMITSSSNNKSSNDDPLQQIPFHWCNAPTAHYPTTLPHAPALRPQRRPEALRACSSLKVFQYQNLS